MSNISTLKNNIDTKTLNLFLLSIATMGIYPLLWLYRSNLTISDITKSKITGDTYIIWIAVCVGLGGFFSRHNQSLFLVLGAILSISSTVLYIVWAFKAKKVLQKYALNEFRFELKMNVFYTFFFNMYYINYCVNDLPEALNKQQILNGQATEHVN
ncbi:DUF4234 domain-containing protein [Photobacterium kishitanii]|uniref:DUF4234 domain-containing protein n=1 Tax=Photobacterium kishitanii TaxID=318456 RepID=A0A0B7JJK4_9GAMM|nr:DUF4234 domain-containing protein [Photobacterium kishitanii]OBU25206.1 hypothetical protein AYY22_20770 [Photobacterium kishitanii]PSU93878.1 DUF4234 domain-containing protein [Photobacterium kishitanii]PSV19906.1 DUF4234 domain-containing protein [Photobacterium kishitanii]PSW67923.1 DUF4234 domain-containing protein [Photobacterium kishitanii]CEO41567.1 conserved membrane hypothetical protein [Photobacterium kishitanii]